MEENQIVINNKKHELNKLIDTFMNVYKTYDYSNFFSYDHCRQAFMKAYAMKVLKDEDWDCLALHLFAFLGSWGMFRGKGFLMYQDYKFLISICKIVLKKEYQLLHIDILDDNKFQQKNYKELIKNITKEIRCEIVTNPYRKYCKNLEKQEIENVTDTFIAKILLVVFGCVPAFDNFGKEGMEFLSIDSNGLNNISGIISFANKHKNFLLEERTKIKQQYGKDYSTMKVLDIIFWSIGAKLEEEKKKEQEKLKKQNKLKP